MTPNNHDNDWQEYRRMILGFCEDTKKRLDDVEKALERLNIDVTVHSTKIAFIGGVAGFITGLIPLIGSIIFHLTKK